MHIEQLWITLNYFLVLVYLDLMLQNMQIFTKGEKFKKYVQIKFTII